MNDDSSNVVRFPVKHSNVEIPKTEEELETSIARIRDTFYDIASVEMSASVFTRASIHGFEVSDNEHIKDCILIVEAIKSLLMKTRGDYHPLQTYAEGNINYDETDMVYEEDDD